MPPFPLHAFMAWTWPALPAPFTVYQSGYLSWRNDRTSKKLRIDSRKGQEIYLLFKTSRLTLEIYEPCIHTGVSFTGDGGTENIITSIPKIRNESSYTSNALTPCTDRHVTIRKATLNKLGNEWIELPSCSIEVTSWTTEPYIKRLLGTGCVLNLSLQFGFQIFFTAIKHTNSRTVDTQRNITTSPARTAPVIPVRLEQRPEGTNQIQQQKKNHQNAFSG